MKSFGKKILIIAAFMIAMLFTAAFSHINVSLFDAVISFNGIIKQLTNEYKLFIHESRSYVPVRFITEEMGAIVDYDGEKKEISLHYLEERPLMSEINASSQVDTLELTIFSEKVTYKVGDNIRVWATVQNVGNTPVSIDTGNQLFTYSIRRSDEDKPRLFEIRELLLQTIRFDSKDEYRRQLVMQRLVKSPSELTDLSLSQGTYIITAEAKYLHGSDHINQSAEITIEVIND